MSAEPSQESQTSGSTNTLSFSMFFPVFFGVVRAQPPPEGHAGPTEPDRLVALNPLSQRMIVFHGSGGDEDVGTDPLAAAMREVLALSEAEGGRRGLPPASKASILAMKTVEAAEGECPVCLERLREERSLEVEEEEGEEKERPLEVEEEEVAVVKEMPCGHRYHGDCIGKWLGMRGSCPICRYRMPEEEEEDDGGKKAEEGGGEEGAERRGFAVLVRI